MVTLKVDNRWSFSVDKRSCYVREIDKWVEGNGNYKLYVDKNEMTLSALSLAVSYLKRSFARDVLKYAKFGFRLQAGSGDFTFGFLVANSNVCTIKVTNDGTKWYARLYVPYYSKMYDIGERTALGDVLDGELRITDERIYLFVGGKEIINFIYTDYIKPRFEIDQVLFSVTGACGFADVLYISNLSIDLEGQTLSVGVKDADTGNFVVDVTPKIEIYRDNTLIATGSGSLTSFNVLGEKYTIVVSAEGYETYTGEVDVPEGGGYVEISLERPPECLEGETETKTCPGGSTVVVWTCVNGKKVYTETPFCPIESSFIMSPYPIALVGEEITFTSTSLCEEPCNYVWDFGDGSTAEGKEVKHKYTEMGDYTVTLTVTDVNGQTASSSNTIKIVECYGTDYETQECPDGTVITLWKCVDGKKVYTGESCPRAMASWLPFVIGVAIFMTMLRR